METPVSLAAQAKRARRASPVPARTFRQIGRRTRRRSMSERVCPWWRVSPGDPAAAGVPKPRANPRAFRARRHDRAGARPRHGVLHSRSRASRWAVRSSCAVDMQSRMLDALRRRAASAGLADRVTTRLAQPGNLGVSDLAGQTDFVLAFAVVHELPDARDSSPRPQRASSRAAPCCSPSRPNTSRPTLSLMNCGRPRRRA